MPNHQDTRPARPASENAIGPGAQLRRARENHSLSIEAVAAHLHVHPKVIVALETDDYSHLPSSVYVRGYLRNYARIVNLSPEPLLDLYNRSFGSETPPPATLPPVAEDTEERSIRWGVYLGVLGLLALALLWMNRDNLIRYWSESAITGDETAALPTGTAAPETSPPGQPPLAITEKPLQTPAPATANPPQPAPAPTAEPRAATPAPSQPGQPGEPRTVVGLGPDILTVRIAKDSWVAIRDASGQRLVYGTLTAGTVKSMRGQAPFSLVLGNAPAAQVEFNGQTVDHSRYMVGTVARFKISK